MYPADTLFPPETIFASIQKKIIIITSLIQVTSPAKVIRAKHADNKNKKKVSPIGPHTKMGQIINRRCRPFPSNSNPFNSDILTECRRRETRSRSARYLAASTFFSPHRVIL